MRTDGDTIIRRASIMAIALALTTGNTIVTLDEIAKAIGEDAEAVKALRQEIAQFGEEAFGFMGGWETGLFCGTGKAEGFDMQVNGFYMNFGRNGK